MKGEYIVSAAATSISHAGVIITVLPGEGINICFSDEEQGVDLYSATLNAQACQALDQALMDLRAEEALEAARRQALAALEAGDIKAAKDALARIGENRVRREMGV